MKINSYGINPQLLSFKQNTNKIEPLVSKPKKTGSRLPSILLATAGMFLCLNTASPKSVGSENTTSPVEENIRTPDNTGATPNHVSPLKVTQNFHQGSAVGNCVGVSTLKSFAHSDIGLEYLNSIVDKDNNDYIVRFPNKSDIKVNSSIISKYDAVMGNDYAEAITFALYKDAKNLDDNGNWKQGKITNPAQISLSDRGTFQRLTGLEPNCSHGSYKDLKTLEQALEAGQHFIMTTAFKEGAERVSDYKAFPKHEFELVSVNTKENKITIANPWYDDETKEFDMNIDDFQEVNCGINLLGIKKDETGKIVFYNPDNIGTKPGESNYEEYFKFISYEPTIDDINKFFQDKQNKEHNDNAYTLSFWGSLDPEGYEKYVGNRRDDKIVISQDSIRTDMPVYSRLVAERHTPIGLLKQYLIKGTIPNFKNAELQNKRDDIENWLKEQSGFIRFEIQSEHYNDSIKEAKLKKEQAIAEKKKAEEEAKRLAEELKQKEQQARLEKPIIELKNETFSFRPEGYAGGVIPSDIPTYRGFYPKASYNKETRKMYAKDIFGENIVLSFDKFGHILSEVRKKDGKETMKREFIYPENGVRILKENNYSIQQIYNPKGQMIAEASYNSTNNRAIISEFTYSSNDNMYVKKYLSKSVQGYYIDVNKCEEHEYEFNPEGYVKEERIYDVDYETGKRRPDHEEKIVYLSNGTRKYYWNGEFKATHENDGFHDVFGNKINGFVLKDLPTKVEE